MFFLMHQHALRLPVDQFARSALARSIYSRSLLTSAMRTLTPWGGTTPPNPHSTPPLTHPPTNGYFSTCIPNAYFYMGAPRSLKGCWRVAGGFRKLVCEIYIEVAPKTYWASEPPPYTENRRDTVSRASRGTAHRQQQRELANKQENHQQPGTTHQQGNNPPANREQPAS